VNFFACSTVRLPVLYRKSMNSILKLPEKVCRLRLPLAGFKLGEQLSELRPSLSDNKKLSLTGQLTTSREQVRRVPSPRTFSSVKGGPFAESFLSYTGAEPVD
jgi:hypothetical protein